MKNNVYYLFFDWLFCFIFTWTKTILITGLLYFLSNHPIIKSPAVLFSRLLLLLGFEDVFHGSLDILYDVLVQLKITSICQISQICPFVTKHHKWSFTLDHHSAWKLMLTARSDSKCLSLVSRWWSSSW